MELPEQYKNHLVYIAKPNTFYMEGTQCELLADYKMMTTDGSNVGLFQGVTAYDGLLKQETCGFDEFDLVEKWLIRCRGCNKTKYEIYNKGFHKDDCEYIDR
jgi:hypothetical protein